MKKFLVLLFTLFCISATAQSRYFTKEGRISFFSEAPLENIEAHNQQVTSILDFAKSEVAITLLMKSFKFEKSLMEEHFNENYIESSKYPKAIFTGSFKSESAIDANKNGVYPVTIDGSLTLHGVTQPIKTTGSIEVKNGSVVAKTKFKIAIKDYNIEVPKLVVKNIAEIVEVTAELPYTFQKN
jgi:polyisoprenoid-binding protein YceI